jgi:hypothetical protein
VQKFKREWQEKNPLVITQELCLDKIADLQAIVDQGEQAITAEVAKPDDERDMDTVRALQNQVADVRRRQESWKATRERMGERNAINVPQDVPDEQVMLHGYPKALKMKKELCQLLALILIPDSELLPLWLEQDVHDELYKRGLELLTISEPGELIQLGLVTKEVLGDEFRPLAPLVRRLLGQEETQPEPEKEPEPTPTSDSLTSSTPSPALTDGESTPSASESRGVSPSLSSTA